MSDEFCTFVPDDPSCQQAAEPDSRPAGGEDRPMPEGGDMKMDDHSAEKEARGMEA